MTTTTTVETDNGTDLTMLRKDLRAMATELKEDEVRNLVALYYQVQDHRKASNNMARAAEADEKPHALLEYFGDRMHGLEDEVRIALDTYTKGHIVGQWLRDIKGIGPVISAGLLAHIDVTRAPYAGHIWNFAGLNPGVVWKKGQKRPFNAALKTLCWKAGDSFVKVSGRDGAFYGKMYLQRKALEYQKNENGLLADAAKKKLEVTNIRDKKTRKIYESGRLPPGHLLARARRATVKMFIAHLHAVMYWYEYKELPPKPYALAHLADHTDAVYPPNPPWGDKRIWK